MEERIDQDWQMDCTHPPIPNYHSETRPARRNGDDPERSVHDHVHPEYSVGTSNGPSCYSLETMNEESEATSSPMSDDEDEEEEEIKPVFPAKRRRINSELHNLSERKRREKIKEKMRALQALIPNADKVVDTVSMLDKAIDHIKSLQLQLQFQLMVTMGIRLCVAPTPMRAANVIMGMRMPIGVGFCQFPNRNMPGFYAGGMLSFPPASQPPFIPLVGGSSALAMPCHPSSGPVPDLVFINNNHNVN